MTICVTTRSDPNLIPPYLRRVCVGAQQCGGPALRTQGVHFRAGRTFVQALGEDSHTARNGNEAQEVLKAVTSELSKAERVKQASRMHALNFNYSGSTPTSS